MKKVILTMIFILSMVGFSKNGVWEIVSETPNSKVKAIFVGDSNELSKFGDSENPSGIFIDYLESSVTQGDGTDLKIIESKYKVSDLKSGTTKVNSLSTMIKSAQLAAVISEKYDHTLIGLFTADAYKDIKVYDKGNKTIVNYINLYIIFDKGDAGFRDASGWN